MASRFKFKILNKAHFKLIFSIKRDDNRKNAAEFSVKICKICQKPLNSPVLSNNKADCRLFRSLLCQIYSAKEFVLISSAQNLTK